MLGEPLRQAHRKRVSSVSTQEPAVTHRAPHFPHGVGGDSETLQPLPATPQLHLQDPFCCTPAEDGPAPGTGTHPVQRLAQGPQGKALIFFHHVLWGQPLPSARPHGGRAAPHPPAPLGHTDLGPSSALMGLGSIWLPPTELPWLFSTPPFTSPGTAKPDMRQLTHRKWISGLPCSPHTPFFSAPEQDLPPTSFSPSQGRKPGRED